MDNAAAIAKWAIAGVVAGWVSLTTAVQFLLIFMVLDYATGMIAGALEKKLSSEVGLRGLGKKSLIILLVSASHIATAAAQIPYDLGSMVATAYCINELISITENCARSGVPIPAPLLDLLEKAKKLGKWDGVDRRTELREFEGPERRAP